MYYDTLNSEEQVSYLIKPILEVLQAAGGQLERSEIRDRISELESILRNSSRSFIHPKKRAISIRRLTSSLTLPSKSLGMLGLSPMRSTIRKLRSPRQEQM